MIIIGERINSSIKKIEKAIIDKNISIIKQEILQQYNAGASVIDLNAGIFLKTEPQELCWLIKTADEMNDLPAELRFALDSSNPNVIEAGLAELKKTKWTNKTIVNSITADDDKMELIMPLIKEFNAQLIGLCMNENGIPDDPSKRYELGMKVLHMAEQYEIPKSDIYLDPLVLPISTDINKGNQALETIRLLKTKDSKINTVIGLSNISFGLPEKPLLNRIFLILAMGVGLDAAILNPLDKELMKAIKATDTLMGKDDFCMGYIKAYRNGEL